jgi:hypothetical protein
MQQSKTYCTIQCDTLLFELIHITSFVTNYNTFDFVDPSLTTHLGKKTYKHSQT